ncbi:MAG: ParB/RepB/Spo0J family partition protein, partial [Bacilli bacterium]
MLNEKQIVELSINDVLPNRFQPRIKFDENSINELALSIKKYGVIQPIVVRKIGDKYEIIAGERRYKASVIAGKTTIPAIVSEFSDNESVEIALIENVQREDLTPIEKAISYKKILDMGYMNQEALAQKIGKSQSAIANTLRLLGLGEEVQESLLENKISERHARSLLKLKSENEQVTMLKRIIDERLTVRKTDEEIEKMLNNETMNNYGPVPMQDDIVAIPDMAPVVNNNIQAPGFMNIENIAANAQDIITEQKPAVNMANLLQPDGNAPIAQAPVEPKDEDILQPGKFFNFFGNEEQTTGNENYNFDNFFAPDAAGNNSVAAPTNQQPMYQAPVEPVVPTYEAPSAPVYEQPMYQAPVEPV